MHFWKFLDLLSICKKLLVVQFRALIGILSISATEHIL